MIKVSGPSITDLELRYVADAARNAWQENHAMYHGRFERAFADYHGVPHAVALPSCTSAIHLALLAAGVGAGDEVIVPEVTWVASAAPVTYVGAVPVFADIDPDTWCMTPASFEERITPRTRAVIPVDLYGAIGDLPEIARIAERRNIAVIEDAAQAFGARRAGRNSGTFGRMGVFSLHGSKTITTGEGGMLITDDAALCRRVRMLSDHGRAPDDRSLLNQEIGHKYKMSAMQAAMGLAQLERAAELIAMKRAIFSWYQEELGDMGGLRMNAEPAGLASTFWMVTIIGEPALPMPKERLIAELKARGIESRPVHYPLSATPAYARYASGFDGNARNPVAYRVSANGINLPSGLQLTRDDVATVGAAVRDLLG